MNDTAKKMQKEDGGAVSAGIEQMSCPSGRNYGKRMGGKVPRADESSNLSGKWSNAVTPYLTGIMDAFNHPHIREIYLCKGSQLGGTEALINMLGYIISEDPGPTMIVYPSDDLAKDISNDKLKPAFRLIPEIRKQFYENSSKELRLKFKSMTIYLRGAGSPSKLA